MRNTLLRSITITAVLALLLLGIAACTPEAPSQPPAREGEPILSISGATPTGTNEAMNATTAPANNSANTMEQPQPTAPQASANTPSRTVQEGELVSFEDIRVEDPDGDDITLTFSEPLDRNGRWQTQRGDAGEYLTTIAASDGKSTSTQEVLIIVESINSAPTLSASDITVDEGDTVTINAQASDEDGDDVTLTFSGWMSEATRQTTTDDIGTHTVTITASDGFESTTTDITITVNDVNHAPQLSPIDDIEVTEGDTVRVLASATDADEDTLTYTYGEPLDERGQWTTTAGDEGNYNIRVTVSDGENTDNVDFEVTVLHKNSPPQIELAQSTLTVDEGDTVRIQYEVSDAENDDVSVTFSDWMESATYTTTYDDAGEHQVTITASDGQDETSKIVTVIVRDQNRPPVFDKNSFS